MAVQTEDGGWAVLDRRLRERIGSATKLHERAEQRAARLNAAAARLRAEGRLLTRAERDRIDTRID